MYAEMSGDSFSLAQTQIEGAAAVLLCGPDNMASDSVDAEILQSSLGLATKGANLCIQLGNRGGLARCALVQVIVSMQVKFLNMLSRVI